MALTRTLLTAGGDTANTTSYTTASITRGANRLVVVLVQFDPSGSGVTPTVSGAGLTYDLVARNIVANSTRTVCIFRGLGATSGSGAITINATQAQDGCIWHVFEYDGVDTSGTNGSGATAHVLDAEGVETAVTNLSVPLPNAAAAGNEWLAIIGQSNAAVVTTGTGWTQRSDQEIVTPAQRASVQSTTTESALTASWQNSLNAFVAAIEVKVSASGPATATLSGSGTLSAGVIPSVARSAGLSGSGTLSATTAPAVTRTATLSGSGTLAAAIAPPAVGFSGSGTLTAVRFGFVAADFSGSGTLAAVAAMAVARAAALSGSGTLAATPAPAWTKTAAFSGSGTLTTTRTFGVTQAVGFSGSGTLVVIPTARYRFALWTGTVYRRLDPKVWDGTTWRTNIPVDIVPATA